MISNTLNVIDRIRNRFYIGKTLVKERYKEANLDVLLLIPLKNVANYYCIWVALGTRFVVLIH